VHAGNSKRELAPLRVTEQAYATDATLDDARLAWVAHVSPEGDVYAKVGEWVESRPDTLWRAPGTATLPPPTGPTLTEARVINFQNHDHLSADGIVGPITWGALPNGGPMPLLSEGSTGQIVSDLQNLLTNDAPTRWGVTPQGVDGDFGPHTRASVEAFQKWGKVGVDGVVGDQTWSVQLLPAIATLETGVGLKYVIG